MGYFIMVGSIFQDFPHTAGDWLVFFAVSALFPPIIVLLLWPIFRSINKTRDERLPRVRAKAARRRSARDERQRRRGDETTGKVIEEAHHLERRYESAFHHAGGTLVVQRISSFVLPAFAIVEGFAADARWKERKTEFANVEVRRHAPWNRRWVERRSVSDAARMLEGRIAEWLQAKR